MEESVSGEGLTSEKELETDTASETDSIYSAKTLQLVDASHLDEPMDARSENDRDNETEKLPEREEATFCSSEVASSPIVTGTRGRKSS